VLQWGQMAEIQNYVSLFPMNNYISSRNIWSEQAELASTLRAELLDCVSCEKGKLTSGDLHLGLSVIHSLLSVTVITICS